MLLDLSIENIKKSILYIFLLFFCSIYRTLTNRETFENYQVNLNT